jgi:LmbE family N-acetylglucosaminyl deacetylase
MSARRPDSGLLFVLAHPDDETISAGTIAKYTTAGVPVGLVCATRGERGSTADLCTIEELPRMREAEVRESARLLGIGKIDFLPCEDQKLWSAPLDEMRRELVRVIREQRPRVVITFEPNGANEHIDHISISRFLVDALPAAADPRWYPDSGEAHKVERVLWQILLPREKARPRVEIRLRPGIDFLIDVREFSERKRAAYRTHRTQLPGLDHLYRPAIRMSFEAFRLGCGERPARVPADDLFAS